MKCWKCGEIEESQKHTKELCRELQTKYRDSTYNKRPHYWADLSKRELEEVANRLASYVEMRPYECDDDVAVDVLQDSGIIDEFYNTIR